jgi:hypothetical protein
MRWILVGMALAACGGGGDHARVCRDGEMHRIEKAARERWRAPLGEADDYAIAIGDAGVVARAGDRVVGVDPGSGEERFRRDLPGADELAVVGEVAVVGVEDALVGLDVERGEERWRTPLPVAYLHWLHADGDRVYLTASARGSQPNVAIAVDAATGAIVWSIDVPGEAWLLGLDGGRGFAVGDDVVVALELATGKLLWERTVEHLDKSDGLGAANGRIYVGFPWRFEARSALDGNPFWKMDGDRPGDFSSIHADRDRAVIMSFRVYVHTDPPDPGPGDVGTQMIGFGRDGDVVFRHDVTIGAGDADRRPFGAMASRGDRIAATVDDRLHLYSLCDVSYVEVPLGGAPPEGNIALAGDDVLVVLPGGELARIGAR